MVAAKANLASVGIPVTVSEMAYGYQKSGGAQEVLDAVDFVNIHVLPFFAQDASTGKHPYLSVAFLEFQESTFQQKKHGP